MMDYGRADRAERLAAEYALGTLAGPARRRFERLLPAHPALAAAARQWSRRLHLLADAVPPVAPPERVWQAIATRLFGSPATQATPASSAARASAAAGAPWWRGLAFWRALSALSLAALLVVAIVPGRLGDRPAPAVQAPLVVILETTPDGARHFQGGFVASVSADGSALVLKPLAPIAVEAGRALELWAVPAAGAPRSLGLVDREAGATVLRANVLGGTAALAISLEPAGGAPAGAPTGPIVSLGKLQGT